MKYSKWLGVALAYTFVLFSLTAPDIAPAFKFGNPSTHSGRPLTPAEVTTLEDAIDNIATPPPDSLTYVDENSDTHTVSCWEIAYDLICQLHEGRIEAETLAKGSSWTLPDSQKSPDNDPMNVDPVRVANAAASAQGMRTLEGILVHEWMHKNQDAAALDNNDESEEIAPYSVMAAYYCSTAVTPGDVNDHNTKWAIEQMDKSKPPPAPPTQPLLRPIYNHWNGDFITFLLQDATGTGNDSLINIDVSDDDWLGFSLGSLRGSDLLLINDSPMVPPDHTLMAIFGGLPATGNAQIWLLDFYEGIINPVWEHNFGPVSGDPPRFFYSVTKVEPWGPWYVLDSLNHQILMMEDMQYGDQVPDEITGVFADVMTPGMEFLMMARGVEAVNHPMIGPGVLVLEEDVHLGDCYYPYDWNFFLVDTDFDFAADLVLEVPLYEFLEFKPDIQTVWDGETSAQVFGTYGHMIEVWTTDGDIALVEQLGTVILGDDIYGTCAFSRPVATGEFLMALDATTGDHLLLPSEVIDPTPYEITMNFDSNDGMLKVYYGNGLKNCHYELWSSDDSEVFYNTGLISEDGNFEFPLPPQEMQFYQIKAVR